MDELLTVRRVARHLKCRDETVRRYIAEGRLTALQIPGGYYRIREKDLNAFLVPVGKRKERDSNAEGD